MISPTPSASDRSIPAWAGETVKGASMGATIGVDPRVGGGDASEQRPQIANRGRSPRGRGRLWMGPGGARCEGSIPAWAGETGKWSGVTSDLSVDPRVGGGDSNAARTRSLCPGRSPRGRGRQPLGNPAAYEPGSIPAWAGETRAPSHQPTGRPVDPRVGGGDSKEAAGRSIGRGRSPRGRGRPVNRWAPCSCGGSIPAWAGETSSASRTAARWRVDPRVGGGDTSSQWIISAVSGRSPRGRGRPQAQARRFHPLRSIPAWAGETAATRPAAAARAVDPRVGGGDPLPIAGAIPRLGRSPRGRGRRVDGPVRVGNIGSIPAWAGETSRRCGGH